MTRPIAVELCCGFGGLGIGLSRAGYDVVKAYDSWPDAVAVYNWNVGSEVATECNLVSPKGRDTVFRDCAALGGVDLLAAGPPCKGFSQIRNGQGTNRNPHNRVLYAVARHVGRLRPRYVLIENVPALVTHRGGETLRELLARLSAPRRGLRYSVSFEVYDAATCGTPQARRRLIVLGVRSGEVARLPQPGTDLRSLYAAVRRGGRIAPRLKDFHARLQDPSNDCLVTAAQALSDLPDLPADTAETPRQYRTAPTNAFQRRVRAGAAETVSNTKTPAVKPTTVERLNHVPLGGCARDLPKHLRETIARRFDSAYRRLHPDAPATALSTKYDCVYHFSRHRALSVREYARLQGIPDQVSFPAELTTRRNAYAMIGNSVPPSLVEWVVSEAIPA